ncbi:MAG: right-handed parallel beta-helix repeat-containing protein [Planctomycetaceae bacterium]|nr:right-handed parallel beta-helix repeat-containing protein [Planctomycetaceae bacterium]
MSPGGDDANGGTADKPVATIAAARDLVRAKIAGGMKEDIVVHVGAGNYFIEAPVVFDDRDGGRDGHTITYRGAPNLGSRLYGGRRIVNWKKHSETEVAADVPDLQEHFTLYENDRAANGGMFHQFEGTAEGNWRREGTRLIYIPRRTPIEEQVVVLGTAKDVLVIKGRSMEQIAGNLVFDGLYMIGSDFASQWTRGVTDFIGWDGQYDGRLWNGRPLGVMAPDMRHAQVFVENARNIVIRNCKLYGAGFMAGMFHRWAQDNRVENCWIENAGCNGLFFLGWECGRGPFKTLAASYVNKKNVVRNNVFYDIGRFAFDGGGVYVVFSGDNVVEHNVFRGITRYGVATKGWRPKMINILYRYTQTPQRNESAEKPFDDAGVRYYDGYVVTEANQGAELNHSRNNVVRYNDFSQIARSGSDMGMIEMWGAGTGNVWEYNALHDQVQNGGWDEWMHTLFNDDGSHAATLRGNVMYWIVGGGRSRAIMAKGNDQANVCNIVADSMLSGAATIGPFVEAAHDMIWSHNILAAQIPTLYHGGHGHETVAGVAHPILKQVEGNVYWYQPMGDQAGSKEDRVRIQRQVEETARGGKMEKGSLYADPMFDRKRPWWDAHYTDYRLKADSPALKLGFQQTDMAKIGLRNDYPFKLTDVLAHPAGETWKAANFTRLYKMHAAGERLRPYATRGLDKGAWVRYGNVDFGDGRFKLFRARLEWLAPRQAFATTLGGKTITAMELGDSWCPIPYWQVSPAYTQAGRKGPELIDVPFAPEKDPAAVAWTTVTEPLVSRATVKHPLGVINCDVANGENHANSAAYMRSSIYAKSGGRTGVEIRGSHGVKVWLNGKEVFSKVGGVNDSPRVAMTFRKGWNELLVKVVQDDKPWKPDMHGWGNFWASVTMHYRAVGDAFIVPGPPGKELAIQPHQGTAVELRLDAPDGGLIGELQFGQPTCPIKKTIGRHDLFLIFPNQNVQTLDWFRFEGREGDEQIVLPEPVPEQPSSISASGKLLVINVMGGPGESRYVAAGRQMKLDELTAMLKSAVKGDPHLKTLIRGDRNALHGTVAAAVAACKEAGVGAANIAYDVRPAR